jgi:hypothetical protein
MDGASHFCPSCERFASKEFSPLLPLEMEAGERLFLQATTVMCCQSEHVMSAMQLRIFGQSAIFPSQKSYCTYDHCTRRWDSICSSRHRSPVSRCRTRFISSNARNFYGSSSHIWPCRVALPGCSEGHSRRHQVSNPWFL